MEFWSILYFGLNFRDVTLVWCTYLMTNLEFLNEFVTIAYQFQYLNITNYIVNGFLWLENLLSVMSISSLKWHTGNTKIYCWYLNIFSTKIPINSQSKEPIMLQNNSEFSLICQIFIIVFNLCQMVICFIAINFNAEFLLCNL